MPISTRTSALDATVAKPASRRRVRDTPAASAAAGALGTRLTASAVANDSAASAANAGAAPAHRIRPPASAGPARLPTPSSIDTITFAAVSWAGVSDSLGNSAACTGR